MPTTYTIGRGSENDIVVDDPSVSRRHAELVIARDGRYFLTDCVSTNGTWSQDDGQWQGIRQDYVDKGTRLRIGKVEMTVAELLARRRGGS